MRKPARIPVCHPDRPHQGRGLCKSCYNAAYEHPERRTAPGGQIQRAGHAVPIPPPPDASVKVTRPTQPSNLEIALGIGDYWRSKCLALMEENLLLKSRMAQAIAGLDPGQPEP